MWSWAFLPAQERSQPHNSATFTKGTVGTNKSHKPHSAQSTLALAAADSAQPTVSLVGPEGTLGESREGVCHAGQIEGTQQTEKRKGCRCRTRFKAWLSCLNRQPWASVSPVLHFSFIKCE